MNAKSFIDEVGESLRGTEIRLQRQIPEQLYSADHLIIMISKIVKKRMVEEIIDNRGLLPRLELYGPIFSVSLPTCS
jgi:hypothetical protein